MFKLQDIASSQWVSQGALVYEDLTQEGHAPVYSQLMSHMSSTMLLHMMEQGSQSGAQAQCPVPLPDSTFIASNKPLPRPTPLTTATNEGKKAARKRKGPTTKQVAKKIKKKIADSQQLP